MSEHAIGPRREAMLGELVAAMRRHHRRRRGRRRAAGAVALLLVAAAGVMAVVERSGTTPAPGPTVHGPRGGGVPHLIRRVEGRTGRIRVIGDGELLERLRELDRPAGLIRIEGRAVLTDSVADAEPREPAAAAGPSRSI